VSAPWYRDRWPWILMSGPAAVIVAGAVSAVLAVRSADGLVADDYYKRGLEINRTLARAEHARRLGLSASASFSGERVRVELAGPARGLGPDPTLRLTLVHPTVAGRDLRVELRRSLQARVYEGVLPAQAAAPRRVVLEDEAGGWRLVGTWDGGARAALAPG
jgi:uncharacterized protein